MTDNAKGYPGLTMVAMPELEQVDLNQYTFAPECDVCGKRKATTVAQGCADAHPVLMCDPCLDRGLEVIAMYVKLWMRCNKQVMICGHCYRPMLSLDTHIDVRRLPE